MWYTNAIHTHRVKMPDWLASIRSGKASEFKEFDRDERRGRERVRPFQKIINAQIMPPPPLFVPQSHVYEPPLFRM